MSLFVGIVLGSQVRSTSNGTTALTFLQCLDISLVVSSSLFSLSLPLGSSFSPCPSLINLQQRISDDKRQGRGSHNLFDPAISPPFGSCENNQIGGISTSNVPPPLRLQFVDALGIGLWMGVSVEHRKEIFTGQRRRPFLGENRLTSLCHVCIILVLDRLDRTGRLLPLGSVCFDRGSLLVLGLLIGPLQLSLLALELEMLLLELLAQHRHERLCARLLGLPFRRCRSHFSTSRFDEVLHVEIEFTDSFARM